MGYGTRKTDEITKQGNVFNGVEQLVKTDVNGKLPAIDGSLLTGIVGLTTQQTQALKLMIARKL